MTAPFPDSSRSALLTDLYELTMACAFWKSGMEKKEAAFHLAFRTPPFGSGFTIACGLEAAISYLQDFHFPETDLAYLSAIPGLDKKPLFEPGFLDHLRNLRFDCDVHAVPEGTVVFPHEPLLRVEGPILQAQIIETALLNFLNFQSLIATKAARICLAARGEPVIEFGLRRAQGPDGGLSASRAAFVGGCAGTSNVLAGQRYGIPVSGTHAHSWVMAFDNEPEAFSAYARALPNNCTLLVDTYDSLQGVRHAIEVGKELRKQGHDLAGIRLDSGDLAFLSIEARKLLDAAGFNRTAIIASNELDEELISSLKQQGAPITIWGVGTKLVTAYDHPALGGVYKLSAIRDNHGAAWQPKLKLSEQRIKITNPGILQVRRFRSASEFLGDAIYDASRPAPETFTIVDPLDATRRKHFDQNDSNEDLLVPIFKRGQLVYEPPPLNALRHRAQQQLAMLHPGVKRAENPHQYPAGLELSLHELKIKLVLKARREVPSASK
ncbi:MAG: nicotinate phosphoribosyltransferase [Verrucomicrobia bacterium]|nr:MAG: nicotinate phosphoribosyltransferase [Verrucomicrobiota bacterium]